MRLADRSDVFFIAVLAVLFGTAAVIFFGRAVTEPHFWITLLSIVPAILLLNLMRGPLRGLDRLPRFVSWFSMGVAAAVCIALIGGRDFILLDFVWYGFALALFDLAGERFFAKDEAE